MDQPMKSEPIPGDAVDTVSALIDTAERILVASHKHPDGDAVGCLLGMSNILRLMGKPHTVLCSDGIPQKLRFLKGSEQTVRSVDGESFDATLLFDTSDSKLLPEGFPDETARGHWVVIDHHRHFEAMGDVAIRRAASSTGEILFELARTSKWPIDEAVAECLYTSIVSDTSSFRYESATPSCHLAAAELIRLGADPWRVASNLFESFPVARQRLLAQVLDTVEVSLGGRFASLVCTREMLRQSGASQEDLDGMVNFARAVEGVALAALVREEENGGVRVSLRSKGQVNASLVAQQLGGGGHVNAGGCYLKNTAVAEAVMRVREAAEQILANPS